MTGSLGRSCLAARRVDDPLRLLWSVVTERGVVLPNPRVGMQFEQLVEVGMQLVLSARGARSISRSKSPRDHPVIGTSISPEQTARDAG